MGVNSLPWSRTRSALTGPLVAAMQQIADWLKKLGTRRLLGNLFELQDLGRRDLKGIGGPARAWAALRARSVESRFDALHGSGLTALVGRGRKRPNFCCGAGVLTRPGPLLTCTARTARHVDTPSHPHSAAQTPRGDNDRRDFSRRIDTSMLRGYVLERWYLSKRHPTTACAG